MIIPPGPVRPITDYNNCIHYAIHLLAGITDIQNNCTGSIMYLWSYYDMICTYGRNKVNIQSYYHPSRWWKRKQSDRINKGIDTNCIYWHYMHYDNIQAVCKRWEIHQIWAVSTWGYVQYHLLSLCHTLPLVTMTTCMNDTRGWKFTMFIPDSKILVYCEIRDKHRKWQP